MQRRSKAREESLMVSLLFALTLRRDLLTRNEPAGEHCYTFLSTPIRLDKSAVGTFIK